MRKSKQQGILNNSRGKATIDILKFKRDEYDTNNNNIMVLLLHGKGTRK